MPPRAAGETHRAPAEEETEDEAGECVYQCTACEEYIKSSFDAFLHPLLKCLMCRKCHTEYRTGDFSEYPEGVDENGIDNFCRWCIEGGQLFLCNNHDKDSDDKCTAVFCEDCVRRNVPDDPALQPTKEGEIKWVCYVCDPSPLKELRRQAQEAIVELSQRDLKRSRENTTSSSSSSSQHAHKSGSERGSTTNGKDSNRKDSETTQQQQPPESPAATASSRSRQKDGRDAGPSSTNGAKGDKDLDESGSERKKRRLEAGTTSLSSSTQAESERRESSARKDTSKKKDEEVARDPESLMIPPSLEKPKQARTSLRNTRPSSTTATRVPLPAPTGTLRTSIGFQASINFPVQPIARSSIPTAAAAATAAKTTPQPAKMTPQPPKTTPQPAAPEPKQSGQQPNSVSSGSTIPSPAATTTTTPTAMTTANSISNGVTNSASAAVAPSPAKSAPIVAQVQKSRPSSSCTAEVIDLVRAQPSSLTNGAHRNIMPKGTKGVKMSTEQIKPTTKVKLSDQDLKARLDNFGNIKDNCVKEINIKFQNILEMFLSKDLENKLAIKNEIEDLETPMLEFNTMLINLKSLYSSQS